MSLHEHVKGTGFLLYDNWSSKKTTPVSYSFNLVHMEVTTVVEKTTTIIITVYFL